MASTRPQSRTSLPSDAFNFSGASSTVERSYANAETLLMAPWRAYWMLAFEMLDARHWR